MDDGSHHARHDERHDEMHDEEKHDEGQKRYEDPMDVVITGTDLENAFGRMLRSTAVRATRKIAPTLIPMMIGQWARPVHAWQRVENGRWRMDLSRRGGWQGSRLTQ
eukprot:13063104-Heterocapsa_arctica.AAC.1